MRGSRKHVLDWVSRSAFTRELRELVRPVDITPDHTSVWMPRSHTEYTEARLESFGPLAYPGLSVWTQLESWWLRHTRGANTPNWDIALSCRVEGEAGLVLVEAKANVPELSLLGKAVTKDASERSRQNHEHIGAAIDEAALALGGPNAGVRFSRDRSYQLSNRLAFAWRLASLGLPVVLVYLGFTGDADIADVGEPLRDDAHWQGLFAGHLAEVAPAEWLNQRVVTEAAPFWVLARSIPVQTISTPAA